MQTGLRNWALSIVRRFVSMRTLRLLKALLISIRNDLRRVKPVDIERFRGIDGDIKLNLGCGSNTKPGWINVDLAASADVRVDLRDVLPFPDESCDVIYTEHFLEHLIYPNESVPFLRECRRVLKTGGAIHVGVPDARHVVEACLSSPVDPEFLREVEEEGWGYPDSCSTGFEYINYHFRLDEHHKFGFDLETLRAQLERAGFKQVAAREFDPNLDSQSRAAGTLYVVCVG